MDYSIANNVIGRLHHLLYIGNDFIDKEAHILFLKSDEFLNENITKFDLKIKALEKKITELSNLILIDNTMKEKLESLFKFKEEAQDILIRRN